jgi:thiamine-phosphate diphosphorylase
MILCLVTDRRRLGAAMGAPPARWLDVLRMQVIAAAEAGVDFIQLREPDLEAAALAAFVREVMPCLAGSSSRLLVNDRVDVAIAAHASGVHLKEASTPPDRVRRIAPPGFIVSCSAHTIAAVAARKSADLLIAGTVLPTASKTAVDYLNKDGLAAIVEAAAPQPVIGIGGLDLPAMSLVAASGAAGMAAVGAFVPRAGDDITEFVQKRVKDLRLGFDSASRRT